MSFVLYLFCRWNASCIDMLIGSDMQPHFLSSCFRARVYPRLGRHSVILNCSTPDYILQRAALLQIKHSFLGESGILKTPVDDDYIHSILIWLSLQQSVSCLGSRTKNTDNHVQYILISESWIKLFNCHDSWHYYFKFSFYVCIFLPGWIAMVLFFIEICKATLVSPSWIDLLQNHYIL